MSIIAIGLDLAKNVFAVHGIDEAGKAVLIKPAVICEAVQSPRMAARTRRTD